LVNHGSAFLNNVTITQNKGRGNNPASFRGGGLRSGSTATTVIMNSIIANNDGRGGPNDCDGALTSDSVYNLIRDTTGCGLPPNTITFKLNQDPKLGPLTSNGGPTRTHALSAGSPAIDKGSDMPVPFFDHPSIDQRGYTRSGHGCRDIGAFEFGATPNPISNPRPCPLAPPSPPSNLTIQ
jgi:hypothetical protein